MNTLYKKQQQLFSNEELNSIALFNNLENKKELKIEKILTIIKEKKQYKKLYFKLLKIYNYVNPQFAEKYLIGYIENENISLEFITGLYTVNDLE